MSRSRLVSRLAAGAVAATLATAGLVAGFVSPASAGAIRDVDPPFAFTTDAAKRIQFTADSVFSGTSQTTIRFNLTGTSTANVRASVHESACQSPPDNRCDVDLIQERGNAPTDSAPCGPLTNPNPCYDPFSGRMETLANFSSPSNTNPDAFGPATPGTYDIVVSETRVNAAGTTTLVDSCTACFTLLNPGAPTVTTTSIPNARPGQTISPYAINGTNFTRSTAVEVLLGGQVDPTVKVYAQDLNSSDDDPNPDTATQLTKELEVRADAPGGVRDLRISNMDGQTVICSGCLSIDSLFVDAVSPLAADNRSLRRVAITGRRFEAGATASLVRFPAVEGQPEIVGTDPVLVINGNGTQTLSATFDLVGAAPGSNAYLVRVTNPDRGSGTCACRFTVAGFAPTLTVLDPGAQQVGTDDAPTAFIGTNLARGAKITFSNPGVTVAPGSVTFVSTTRLDALVDVASNAPTGKVDVTVTNTDNQSAVCLGCFEVTAAPESPSPSASPSESPTGPPPAQDDGVYTPLDPSRILDTRDGTGGPRSPLGAGESRPFQVTGRGGVPSAATAVVFNLTAITPTASGFVTAFPTGAARPLASNINFIRGDVIANLVKVRIGAGGQVSLYNNSGATHVAADVVGYFAEAGGGEPSPSASADPSATASADPSATASAAPSATASADPSATASGDPSASPTGGTGSGAAGSRFTAINPQRILDTRDGNGGSTRPIGPGESRELQVTGRAGVPADATAIVFNLTAIRPTASGFLTAFPAGTTRPLASNINFRNGDVIANLVMVRLGAAGRVRIYNHSGDTHAAADVVGYFSPATAAASYTAVLPQRVLDTRNGSGTAQRPLGPGESRSFRVTNLAGVPANATAVAFNLTAITPTASGFLTAYPAGSSRPIASNINFVRGEVIANLVVVRVGTGGQVTLFNNSGSTHAAADIVGYYGPFDPSSRPPSPTPTPSATPTATATATPTASASPTGTAAPTASASPSTVLVAAGRSSREGGDEATALGVLGLCLLVGLASSSGVRLGHVRKH